MKKTVLMILLILTASTAFAASPIKRGGTTTLTKPKPSFTPKPASPQPGIRPQHNTQTFHNRPYRTKHRYHHSHYHTPEYRYVNVLEDMEGKTPSDEPYFMEMLSEYLTFDL